MDSKILIAGGTLVGLAAGAAGGYFLAKKRFENAFVEALREAVDEEVAAVEEHYRILTKRGDEYSSPEAVLARRIPGATLEGVGDPGRVEPHTTEELEQIVANMKYKKWSEDDIPAEVQVTEDLKYWKGNGDPRIIGQPKGKSILGRRTDDPKAPYQISEEAFLQGDEDHEQISLAWYSGDIAEGKEPGDVTLAGVDDDVPYEPIFALGRYLTLEDFGEEKTIYFRNPHTRHDYEVNLAEISYSELVLEGNEAE